MANQEHLDLLKRSAHAWNDWRAHNPEITPDLSGANLRNTHSLVLTGHDLSGANMESVDLSQANLSGTNLESANLRNSLIERANFSYMNKVHANLRKANLRNALACAADFTGVDLTDTVLRDADLKDAKLAGTTGGLRPDQLAGANLTGATLPEPLTKLFEKLETVASISESARKLFIALLVACLYSWLTIATTTDLNLITNRNSSQLPIIQTAIPIVGFYWVAPLLLLCVFFYFHFYLQKLWEELGSLPAIFPDGRRLHERSDPWLLNDLVRAHVPRLKANRPFMSYFQQFISILLAWWLVPITLACFWLRYLPRHGSYGTNLHVALLAISIMAAIFLYRLAARTLRGDSRKSFAWSSLAKSREGYAAVAVLFLTIATLSSLFRYSTNTMLSKCDKLRQDGDTTSRLAIYCSTSANLRNAEISIKSPNWAPIYPSDKGAMEKELQQVVGAQLRDAHLQYADLREAFFAKAKLPGALMDHALLEGSDLRLANLSGAHLSDANLIGARLSGAYLSKAKLVHTRLLITQLNSADLTGADLSGAELPHADLTQADLKEAQLIGANLLQAHLKQADLSDAHLDGADLAFADLTSTRGLQAKQLMSARDWQYAYYDDTIRQALGLPTDHNQTNLELQRELQAQANKQMGPARP